MNKTILTQGIFAVLLLTSTWVSAEEYPATNYQPRVLFHDGDANESAKKSQPVPKAAPANVSVAKSTAVAPKSEPVTTAAKPESDNSIVLIGLLAAGAGFFFYSKNQSKGGSSSKGSDRYYGGDANGLTGVARYLKNLDASAGTGVARYLDKVAAEAKAKADAVAAARAAAAESTGVAKYIKNNVSAVPTVAANAEGEATGVAKYLRNRG